MLNELFGGSSGQISETRTGATARRELVCGWDEAFYYRPAPGTPHPEYPALTVDKVSMEPFGAPVSVNGINKTEYRKIFVDYSLEYRKVVVGDPPRFSRNGRVEVLATGAGRVRDDTHAIIAADEMSATTLYPCADIVSDFAVTEIPLPTILAAIGKVNSVAFYGMAAGTVLFSSWGDTAQYDHDAGQWFFRLTYNFLWRSTHQNSVWFPPEFDRDVNGNIQYYQNKDATKPHYTTDAAKTSRPVYKTGSVGVWTTTSPKNYMEWDLNGLYA